MSDTIRSHEGICEVEYVRGGAADPATPPDLLLEVSHGATRERHFAALRAALRGEYPADLRDFFFVNTDVGAPELARAVAERVVRTQPRRKAIVVRCLLPRTFVDCNRRIDAATVPAGTPAGAMTPGLPPWVRDEQDRQLLLRRYAVYRETVTAAFAAVCGHGGLGLLVHSFAPRSVDVPVDENIVANLHAAYAADRIGTWPLRAAVDLITHDPDGREMAAAGLAQRAHAEFTAAGFDVDTNGAYSLHPVTLAHQFATDYPDRTLCLEVRRDLLVAEFTPFREMLADPQRVERAAVPLAAAVLSSLP
ncbi:MAG: N-formylglutamate amidohydrolase [Planctomycetes bacterium]|nr:N-formylglutamate amidohydrolase [Planctomycetota bacterium]